MILQSLYALYDRLSKDESYQIAPPGHSLQKIGFRVVLHSNGILHAIEALAPDPETKKPKQMIVPGGDKPPGGVTAESVRKKVLFLRNDLPFLIGVRFGIPEGEDVGSTPELATLEHEAFKKHHLDLRDEIRDEEFASVCAFLEQWDPAVGLEHPEWAEFAGKQGVFQIVGQAHYVHERDAVRRWWESRDENADESQTMGECLITGRFAPIARLHEPKIKRVDGAQSSGAPLVSFDKDSDAFSSYGRDGQQGFNAPVSKAAAFQYATALNSLLDGPNSYKHRFLIADATVVFWTERRTETEDIFALFASGQMDAWPGLPVQDEAVRHKIDLFLRALRTGRQAYVDLDGDTDHIPYFILGMTGQAKGRIGVRFFHKDTLSSLLDNLRKHYSDVGIARQYGDGAEWREPEFPGIKDVLDETCPRDKKTHKPDRERISPVLAGPLMRAILTGARYPDGLYHAVMRRVRADRDINYVRASIIKGWLVRNQQQEVSMSLDEGRADPAYRLGRLFAVLERIQEVAHWQQTGRNLEKGIRDNFFSAACSTPASVFPRLERLSTHHRRQLNGGQKHYFDKLIADIKDGQVEPPSILLLRDQGSFLIGYYHQWKKLRMKKEDQEQTDASNQEEK